MAYVLCIIYRLRHNIVIYMMSKKHNIAFENVYNTNKLWINELFLCIGITWVVLQWKYKSIFFLFSLTVQKSENPIVRYYFGIIVSGAQ